MGILVKNLQKLDVKMLEEPILIPEPKEIYQFERDLGFILTPNCEVSFLGCEEKPKMLDNLMGFLNDHTSINLNLSAASDIELDILKRTDVWDLLNVNNPDAYNLEIDNNYVLIYAVHEPGLFYGIQTFLQLCKNAVLETNPILKKDKLILPRIGIKDIPDFKIRAIAQDIARGQVFNLENGKRYIKLLSEYKINQYYLYLEDMFYHPSHPKIGKNRGALRIDEIKELDAYARDHYIELIPIFECLGHVDNILTHPEYEHLGEFPGAQCLDVSNPKIYDFLRDYISKISETFSTKYFHLGLDESWDLGKVRSKEYVNNKGKSEVLLDCYEKLYQIARESGNHHVVMYDDILRSDKLIQEKLNKDLILMYWNYAPKKHFSSIQKYVKMGFRVIISPGMLNWERNFPDTINSAKNIINFAKEAHKYRNKGCIGIATCTWGDQRYYSFRENELFGTILGASVSWTPKRVEYDNFTRKFGFLFYGLEPSLLDKFQEMYELISSSADNYYFKALYIPIILLPPPYYTYFFKHPFPTKKFKPPFKKYEKLGEINLQALDFMKELKASVLFEGKNFEYIEFGAELAVILTEKIDLSLKISKLLNQKDLEEERIKDIISDLEKIKEKFSKIKDKYEMMWLRAAKRPCLDIILRRFDHLDKFYENKIQQLKKGIKFQDPYLPSEWIWADEKSCPPRPRYFRKAIDISSPIKKAIMQGIALNQMKLFVNGEYVGEVLGRLSLSILPITNRVKTWDITKLLKKGKNIIAVEAYNHEGFKGAINLYGQVQLDKKEEIIEINSDSSWLTLKNELYEADDWKELTFDDSSWEPARTYGPPPSFNGDIYKMDLLAGEHSDTQDYFGIEGYFYNLISTFASDFMAKIAKPLIPGAVKLLKPYGK